MLYSMAQKIDPKLHNICLDVLGNNAEKGIKLYCIESFLFKRWHNHLNPDIKKERWTEEED